MTPSLISTLFICCFCLSSMVFSADLPPAPEIKLWPGIVPGDENYQPPKLEDKPIERGDVANVTLVTDPTLTLFKAPTDKANGTAVLICPGGAYNFLAWDKEGLEIAQWMNSLGVTAVILKYRVPRRSKETPHAAPLQDAQRGLRLMRQHAEEWGINPKAVGILGFSAGGHLSVMAGVSWKEMTYPTQDDADALSCRPDFLIPIYPAYLGGEKKAGPLSPLVQVTNETPPVFMAVTNDDQLRGLNAALFYVELKKAGVLSELHIYTKGGHGYGMRPTENPVHTWTQRCEEWLRAMAFIPKPTNP